MKHSKAIVIVVLLLGLVLVFTGCGGSTNPAADSFQGSGTYTASFGSIKVTLQLPAKTDTNTQAIEEVAYPPKLLIYDRVTIASINVNNGSKKPVDCSQFTIKVTNVDKTVTSGEIVSNDVLPLVKTPNDPDFMKQGADLCQKLQEHETANPGSTGTAYYLFDLGPQPTPVKKVTVTYETPTGSHTKTMLKTK